MGSRAQVEGLEEDNSVVYLGEEKRGKGRKGVWKLGGRKAGLIFNSRGILLQGHITFSF